MRLFLGQVGHFYEAKKGCFFFRHPIHAQEPRPGRKEIERVPRMQEGDRGSGFQSPLAVTRSRTRSAAQRQEGRVPKMRQDSPCQKNQGTHDPQPINHLINQSFNQSIKTVAVKRIKVHTITNQSINHLINQSFNQSII